MASFALAAFGILFLIIQYSVDKKSETKNNGKYADKFNYYGFSRHRGFLMGFAAVMIVIFHGRYFVELGSDIGILNAVFNLLWQFNIGVEIFLLLSGIGLYFSFESKNVNFKQYYMKRLLNVYLISLIVDLPYVIYSSVFIEKRSVLTGFLEWTKLLNWNGKAELSWYVAFIMVMYAIYPLIYKLMKRLEKTKYEFLVVCAFGVFAFGVCFVLNHFFPNVYGIRTALMRVPVFIAGCYLGKLVYNKQQYSNRIYVVCAVGIIMWAVLTYIRDSNMVRRVCHCLLSVALCVILISIADFLKSKVNFVYKFFDFLGSMSLELYLVHMNIETALFNTITKNGGSFTIVHYGLAAVISFIIAYFVSKLRRLIVARYTDYCKRKNIADALSA